MAQTIVKTDDFDSTLTEDVETVAFAYKGKSYEIDLSTDNRDEMDKLFGDYITAGRAVATSVSTTRKRSATGSTSDAGKIREWLSANGHEVSTRGRISAELRAAYEAANPA